MAQPSKRNDAWSSSAEQQKMLERRCNLNNYLKRVDEDEPIHLQSGAVMCGLCGLEILKRLPWFKCGECSGALYICLCCFVSGKEGNGHTKDHMYQVMDNPMVSVSKSRENAKVWSAMEEMALLSGIEMFGFGNWAAVADHMGTGKTAKMCEEYFMSEYLLNEELEMVEPGKRAEVAALKEKQKAVDQQLRAAQEQVFNGGSVPHVAGYMPLRDDFDVEFMNDAELLLTELYFSPEETRLFLSNMTKINPSDPTDLMIIKENLKLKLEVMKCHNKKLNERDLRKAFVKEKNMLDWRVRQRKWQHATKEERMVRKLLRPLERFSTVDQHDQLVVGLAREMRIRQQLFQQYQDKRKKLVTEATIQQQSTSLSPMNGVATPMTTTGIDDDPDENNNDGENGGSNNNNNVSSPHSSSNSSNASTGGPKKRRKLSSKATNNLIGEHYYNQHSDDTEDQGDPNKQASSSSSSSSSNHYSPLDKLQDTERSLCDGLEMSYDDYLKLKQGIIQQCKSRGLLNSDDQDAAKSVKIDINKVGRMVDVYLSLYRKKVHQ